MGGETPIARKEKLIITNNTVKFMKKYLFSALAMGLLMTSCQSDEPFAPGEGGEKQVTFTLNVPGELGTRAISGESGAQNNQNADIYYTLVLDANGDKRVLQETTKEKTVTFTTPVVLGRKYDITAYASYTNNIDAQASNIKAIPVVKSFNDETKDAYTAHVEDHDFALSALPTMQLKRPFGKLRLIATDYVETGTVKNTAIDQVTITYQNTTATTYDATTTLFNNVGTGITATKEFNKYYTDDTDGMPIFADYLPANREDNPITFTVTVKYAGVDETYSRTFNDIPVRRNALTTLKGAFFTAGAEIKVEVKDEFETPGKNIKFATTAGQLIEAVNAVEDGQVITLSDNIQFSESARTHNSGTWYDGIYYIGDKSFTIDLNGKTISNDGSVNDYLLNFKNAASTNTRSAAKANTITIKNGTIDAGTAAYCALCTSSVQENQLTINLEDVKVINNISNGSTIKVRGGAILNVKEGTIITGENSYLGIECIASTVNIKEGAEIYMNGTSSYNGCLVGVGGNGTINVSGGKGIGKKGGFIAMTSGGTINVSGGEWIANTNGSVGDNSNLYVLTAQSNKYESGFAGPSVINVTGGTFRGGMDAWVLNNLPEEKAELNISGGNFNADPTNYLAEGYSAKVVDGIYQVMAPVAQVGNTKYGSIDDAIANWTHNTTLTLLSDVTLNDVVKISSTEYHILDLGTFTLTGAKGKNAIEIVNNGRSSASYTLDIKANANNPGGISASSAIVKTTGKSGVKDRPIIRFYNGVFNASNIINHGGSNGTNSPQFMFYNGVYNGNISTNRAICIFEGGTFNGRFFMSVDSSSYARIGGGKYKYMDNLSGSALNSEKFTIGSAKKVFDRGVYVDDEGYIVVGGPVITEFGDKFAAKATNASKAGSYLQYSSAAEHGLYYTNADMAIAKHGAANVELK